MKKLLFLAFLTPFFTSCEGLFETTIKIDSPPFEKKLVVYSSVRSSDSTLAISVTRNFGALEEPQDSAANVKGATVEWFENGILLETFRLDSMGGRDTIPGFPGWFYGSYFSFYGKNWQKKFARAGADYELRVSHPDFETVSAKVKTPREVPITSVKLEVDSNETNGGNFFYGEAKFDIEFLDPKGERNFYELEIESADPDQNGSYFGLNWDDLNLKSGLGYKTVLLSDEFFDGQKIKLRLKNGDINSLAHRVILRSVTEDWYRFSTSAQLNIETSFDPFANPVQVFSNVENGLGIFSVAAETDFFVEK